MPEVRVCEVSTNCENALERLQNDNSYDLILLDLNMPGIDGIDFLQTLRSRKISVPTVALSATEDIRLILDALQAEVLTLLAKGQSNKQIATTLFITEHPVKFHLTALLKVFNVYTRADCILKVQEFGLTITSHLTGYG